MEEVIRQCYGYNKQITTLLYDCLWLQKYDFKYPNEGEMENMHMGMFEN